MNATVQTGIKLPIALQVLRDEIRVLDKYIRQGLLTQDEAYTRIGEWGVIPVPGMHRYDRLALLGVWEDEPIDDNNFKEDVLKHWESIEPKSEPKPKKKEYRTPQSTIDAFLNVVMKLDEAAQKRWLALHPRDKEYLLGLKRCAK